MMNNKIEIVINEDLTVCEFIVSNIGIIKDNKINIPDDKGVTVLGYLLFSNFRYVRNSIDRIKTISNLIRTFNLDIDLLYDKEPDHKYINTRITQAFEGNSKIIKLVMSEYHKSTTGMWTRRDKDFWIDIIRRGVLYDNELFGVILKSKYMDISLIRILCDKISIHSEKLMNISTFNTNNTKFTIKYLEFIKERYELEHNDNFLKDLYQKLPQIFKMIIYYEFLVLKCNYVSEEIVKYYFNTELAGDWKTRSIICRLLHNERAHEYINESMLKVVIECLACSTSFGFSTIRILESLEKQLNINKYVKCYGVSLHPFACIFRMYQDTKYYCNQSKIRKLLGWWIKKYPDQFISVDDKENTLYHYIKKSTLFEAVYHCIDKTTFNGCDIINHRNLDGDTALDLVTDSRLKKKFIDHGAN